MNKYQLAMSPKANASISEIYDYISDTLQNYVAAEKTVDRIMKAIGKLNYAPNRGRLIGKGERGDEIRIIGVKNFVVQFAVDDAKQVVYVLDVIYGRRNII